MTATGGGGGGGAYLSGEGAQSSEGSLKGSSAAALMSVSPEASDVEEREAEEES